MKIQLGFILALLVPGATQAQIPNDNGIISQTGEAVISAKPDQAQIVGGVITLATEATPALQQNAEAMNKVQDSLKGQGIAAEDVATVTFAIQDHYKPRSDGGQGEKDGYVVINRVRVTVKDLPKFGTVLDAMVAAGANSIQSLRFTNSKAATLTDEGRTEAVLVATRRAKLIAEALGCSLGNVVSAHEQTGGRTYNEDDGPGAMFMSASAERSRPTPIAGGSQDFRVSVVVTWKLVKGDGGLDKAAAKVDQAVDKIGEIGDKVGGAVRRVGDLIKTDRPPGAGKPIDPDRPDPKND